MKRSVIRCLVVIGLLWLGQSQAVTLTHGGGSAGAPSADCTHSTGTVADAFSTLAVDFTPRQVAQVAAVPAPAAAWLFGCCLLGLAAGCMRKKAA